jgi:hypothetical protein
VRSGRAWLFTAVVVTTALVASSVAVLAQGEEEFPGPGDQPLPGYTRSDGTIVLTDEAFCAFLLGSLWDQRELTFRDQIDRTRKQRRAKAAAFDPAQDEATISRCAEVVAAYRGEPPEDDSVAPWARRSPVVPEALAGLLPDDLVASPLAVAAPVLEAARTSGFGDTVSAPFEMPEETWLVQVDAAACAEWAGRLIDARDGTNVIEVADNREYLYNVRPGHYYWDVTAPDCDWSVDLAIVEIGEDPNATPLPKVPAPKLYGDIWSRADMNANGAYLTAAQARQALLDAGLEPGECTEAMTEFVSADRVWAQEPIPGTLLELGSPVAIFIGQDCDIFRGERIELP